MDNTVTQTHTHTHTTHTVLSVERTGSAKSLWFTRLTSKVLFISLVRAEEEWSLCGMSAARKKKKKKNSSTVERTCLRTVRHTNTHPRKHGWNTNFLFIQLPSLTHTNIHVHLWAPSRPPTAHKPYSRANNLEVHATIKFIRLRQHWA